MKHVPELDSIRGLAAVTVAIFHAFPYLFFLGWSAVDLFFVLSGYLITTIIVHNLSSESFLRAFYARRALRIWPLYMLVLLVCCSANAASRVGYPASHLALLQHLIFLQNVQGVWSGQVPPFVHSFAPSWSIAVEEQFYLGWPLLLLWLGPRCVVPAATGLLAVSILSRLGGLPSNVIVARGDGLAIGCLLAAAMAHLSTNTVLFQRYRRGFILAGTVSASYVAILAMKFWGNPEPQWKTSTFAAFAILYGSVVGLIIMQSGAPYLRFLRHRVLRQLGTISYSLYLFHSPIMTYLPAAMLRAGVTNQVAIAVCVWVAIFALPVGSYLFL